MSFENEKTNMEKINFTQKIVDDIQTESKRPVCRLQFRMAVSNEIPLSRGTFRVTSPEVVVRFRL